jgi:putative acetyltransferase
MHAELQLPVIYNVNKELMNIRIATTQDGDGIRWLYWSAFPEAENEMVATLAVELLSESSALPIISLVAEMGDAVVGHVAFSPVEIDNQANILAYILAPLAVRPDCQKQRIGSALVEYGMQRLSALGVDIIFVYGAPEYYGRFGFNAEAALGYKAPYPLQYPFGWQAVAIREGVIENGPHAMQCVKALCKPLLW